jgi:tRNA threonylcarbamoyladenosine biosynthesis protein TsaE
MMDTDMPGDLLARLRSGVLSDGVEQTEMLGEALAAFLPEEAILCLGGELGSGKTAFVRGLGRGLGVTGLVTSPTFNLLQIHRGTRVLLHLDAYRLEDAGALDDLGLEAWMRPPYCLAVEWPERVAVALPDTAWWLRFEAPEEATRRIQLMDTNS